MVPQLSLVSPRISPCFLSFSRPFSLPGPHIARAYGSRKAGADPAASAGALSRGDRSHQHSASFLPYRYFDNLLHNVYYSPSGSLARGVGVRPKYACEETPLSRVSRSSILTLFLSISPSLCLSSLEPVARKRPTVTANLGHHHRNVSPSFASFYAHPSRSVFHRVAYKICPYGIERLSGTQRRPRTSRDHKYLAWTSQPSKHLFRY